MSRSDQYIGLTDRAKEFLSNLVSDCCAVKHMYKMIPQAFNPDPLMGEIYVTKAGTIYKEVVQVVPWASGPMYFTCLEEEDTGKKTLLFKWKASQVPLDNGHDYDPKSGFYYV